MANVLLLHIYSEYKPLTTVLYVRSLSVPVAVGMRTATNSIIIVSKDADFKADVHFD